MDMSKFKQSDIVSKSTGEDQSESITFPETMRQEDLEHLPNPIGVAQAQVMHSSALIPYSLPSLFQSLAPAQLDPAGTIQFPAGELRGMYSTVSDGNVVQTRWKPQWSKFDHPRGGGGHNGVDIFAPVGTPLVAVVDGAVTFHKAGNSEIGDRAWLSFKVGTINYRLIYGHLNGFAGSDRSVKRGEVIGYSGCSGNANYAQDCLTAGKCGVASSHVHLILKNDTSGQDLDAVAALGWRLRYADDFRDVPCKDVIERPLHDPALNDSVEKVLRVAQLFPDGLDTPTLKTYRDNLLTAVAHSGNIDLNASAHDRAQQLFALLALVVADLDADKPADHRANIQRFLLHLAWHESDTLRTRAQYNNGPARSLFQFECLRARDELLFLDARNRLSLLTQSAGASEGDLKAAINLLPNASRFPLDNLITRLMETNDLFAARLARLAFRRVPAAIPADLNGHAEYWYDHWKRTGGNPEQLKQTFATAAARVDQLLGLNAAANFYLLRPEAVLAREALSERTTQAATRLHESQAMDGISERAMVLIEHHESGGYDYYTRFALHPYWPGVVSGLTLGFGFDLGYRTLDELKKRFGDLGESQLARLGKAIGVHAGQGEMAKSTLKEWVVEFADITVPWGLARKVLRDFDIPAYTSLTQQTFPTQGLNPDQLGALVSLVFNRGTRLTGERREEMAAIHKALSENKPGEIPALLRAMKRHWPTVPSLQRRREDEARLFEGL